MPSTIITPNMSLVLPVPGVETGPQYGSDQNSSFTLVDSHDHTPGKGVPVVPQGININSDLAFNDNNATTLRSARFTSQGAPLALITDIQCIYVSGADLYYNDSSGNQVRITNNGAVNVTATSLVNGSNIAQFIANQLVVDSAANTPANIVAGSYLMGNNVASGNFVTLQPVNSIPSNYSLTMPELPAVTSLLTIDSTGNIVGSISATAVNLPGSIIMYGGAAAPSGYLLCDGSSVLRATYPDLFTAIGTAYGTADGTHFNVPDFRGIFPRGVTGTSGNDPDASSRTANNAGGNTGNNVGSQQADEVGSHSHLYNVDVTSSSSSFNHAVNGGPSSVFTNTTDAAGGLETRPINLYVNFIIKV